MADVLGASAGEIIIQRVRGALGLRALVQGLIDDEWICSPCCTIIRYAMLTFDFLLFLEYDSGIKHAIFLFIMLNGIL